jgi:hypothetical protein
MIKKGKLEAAAKFIREEWSREIENSYVPRFYDTIVRVKGEVLNPRNIFGERIKCKKIERYLLLDWWRLSGVIPDASGKSWQFDDEWFVGYYTVENEGWLYKARVNLKIDSPVYEMGRFSGMMEHNEKIESVWGFDERENFIYIGNDHNVNSNQEYYIHRKVLIKSLNKYLSLKKYNIQIPEENVVYLGTVKLTKPWGIK